LIGFNPINQVKNYILLEFKEAIQPYAGQPITKQVLLDLLKDYKRPYDKINELIKQQALINVKRGIYVPGPTLTMAMPESFLLANHLSGPSYVSMETALSHWGFIPEKVYEISSATIRKARIYKTKVGRFSYIHVPLPYYAFGIQQIKLTEKQYALVASPEKALCDKIVTTSRLLLRSTKQVSDLLINDFRIDEQDLKKLDIEKINSWLPAAPKKNSLKMLVKTLNSL
jgi:hypothetical protein